LESGDDNIGCVKTTVDIPESELREAMRQTGARTKREALVTALGEFNRRRRLRRLAASFGALVELMTQEELGRMRGAQGQLAGKAAVSVTAGAGGPG
jgi:hypothetical protein